MSHPTVPIEHALPADKAAFKAGPLQPNTPMPFKPVLLPLAYIVQKKGLRLKIPIRKIAPELLSLDQGHAFLEMPSI